MKKLVLAAALTFAGCASLGTSMENGATNAAGDVAGHAVSTAGDRATDAAVDSATHPATQRSEAKEAAVHPAATSRLEADDVLVLDGETYAVGKVLGTPAPGGAATVLLIADGRKVTATPVVHLRAASKTELKLGVDVFYSQDDDVRRGRWAKGAITDIAGASSGHVDVGSARDLDLAGQVRVAR
jgi:hypothetical protein